MKKFLVFLFAILLVLGVAGNSSALFFIDFENGVDGNPVNDIPGISFKDFNGFDSIYGDSRTGKYNTHSDDLNYGSGKYHHNGNLWLWAGPKADARGVIVDFVNDDGTWFQTGYAANSNFFLDAYLTDGSVVSVMGANNYGYPMSYLKVDATAGLYIDYIVLHDTGNYWLADDMSGDASGVSVPEPATVLLLGLGLVGLTGLGRKKFKS